MTLHAQFLTMGLMFGCGLALGIVFDTYRVLTGQLKVPRWLIPPLDLLYWTAATLFVFRVLFFGNQGQVRVFVFIGLFAGLTLHFLLLSPYTIRLVLSVIRLIKWIYRLLVRIVDLMIVTPIIWLYKFFMILLGFVAAVSIFLYKIMLQLFYPFWRLIRFVLKLIGVRLKWPPIILRAWNGIRNGYDKLRRFFKGS